jgi:hypothetical protein
MSLKPSRGDSRNTVDRRRLLTAAALLAAGADVAVALASPALAGVGVPALSPLAVPGRGATVPFLKQAAEYADTNGTGRDSTLDIRVNNTFRRVVPSRTRSAPLAAR